jgi:hypothetical protein
MSVNKVGHFFKIIELIDAKPTPNVQKLVDGHPEEGN